MNQYWKDLIFGGKSLVIGLGVTLKAMLQPIVTVQYPRQKIDVTPNYRGHIDLIPDTETGKAKCITCGLCARACPSGCIVIESEKREGVKGKVLTRFNLDFTKCSLCGMCVESCNSDAITFSHDYELADFSREAFYFDLLKRLEDKKR